MSRIRYISSRIFQMCFLLWFVLTFLFFLFKFLPGSYADIILYKTASKEAATLIAQKWGLNDPLHVQYFRFIINYLQLDAGTSFATQEPVVKTVAPLIFNSFILVAPAITLGYVVGSIIGTIAGINRNSLFDRMGVIPFIIFGTIPEFFLAILFIVVFGEWLDLFPVSGMLSITYVQHSGFFAKYLSVDFAQHYILPFSVIFVRYLFTPLLVMRTNVVETLGQPFLLFHRISGVPKLNRIRNVMRHASLPVITLYPVSMTRALGGLVLVETVFNWPGIGSTLVASVLNRDFPVLQFVFFIIAVFIILSNFLVDIIYGYIDPRVSIDE